jgi:hypothetical protein
VGDIAEILGPAVHLHCSCKKYVQVVENKRRQVFRVSTCVAVVVTGQFNLCAFVCTFVLDIKKEIEYVFHPQFVPYSAYQ